jgi:hypothetical protein
MVRTMLIRLLDMRRGRLLPRSVCGLVGSDIAFIGAVLSSTILLAPRSAGGQQSQRCASQLFPDLTSRKGSAL